MNAKQLLTIIITVSFCFTACVPANKLYYFNDQVTPVTQKIDSLRHVSQLRIQKGDRVGITVTCADPTQTAFLNPFGTANASTSSQGSGFLVNTEGKISFPMLGDLSVDGLTSDEAAVMIKTKLTVYFKDPYVYVSLPGRVFVLTGKSGSAVPIVNERLTIFEAISQAGSQDAYDKKNKVWIIREEKGERNIVQVNLNSSQIFESTYYYLHNNDLVYIEPGRGSSLTNPNNPLRGVVAVTGGIVGLYFLIKSL